MKTKLKLFFFITCILLLCCACQKNQPKDTIILQSIKEESNNSKADFEEKSETENQDEIKTNQFIIARPSVTGKLKVTGNQLTDLQGNPVQLKGISTHGLGWFPEYINQDCFDKLAKDWDVNVIRLAMYTAENNGYCTDGDKDKLKELITNGVNYAINADMYVADK